MNSKRLKSPRLFFHLAVHRDLCLVHPSKFRWPPLFIVVYVLGLWNKCYCENSTCTRYFKITRSGTTTQFTSARCRCTSVNFRTLNLFTSLEKLIYRVVTSARSCNKVGHLFGFTILAQHETNDVILYIHRVHKHRGNSFQRQNYKMRLKQRLKQTSLDWINSMQVKKILFTNVFFSWSLCLLNMFPSMVFPEHFYLSGLLT
jgi:hypothetical protein